MSQRLFKIVLSSLLLASVLLLARGNAPAQKPGAGSVVALQPHIVKFSPQLTHESLVGRPDTDLIELSNGRRIQLGDVRRMLAQSQKIRAAASAPPSVFRVAPAATGLRIQTSTDLGNALRTMRDSDTVQLPSGRRVTVGQIKALQPAIEKRLGHKLGEPATTVKLTGPSIKFATGLTDVQVHKLLPVHPANETILESPRGTRVTVGQIQQYLQSTEGGGTPTTIPAPPAQKGRQQ
jgi:hypothetical protein